MADLNRERDEIERITGLPPSAIAVEWVEGSRNQRVSVTITCDSDAQRRAAYESLSLRVDDMRDVTKDGVQMQMQKVRQIDGNRADYFEIEYMCALPDGRVLGVTEVQNGLYLFTRKRTPRGLQWVPSPMSTIDDEEPARNRANRARDGVLAVSRFGEVTALTTYRHNGEWHVLLADSGARRFRDLDLSEERLFNGVTAAMTVRSFPSYPTPDPNGKPLRPLAMTMHIDGVLYVCFKSSAPGRTFTIRRCFGFDDQRDVPLAVPAAEGQPFTPEHRQPSPATLPAHMRSARRLRRRLYDSSSSSSSSDDESGPQKRARQSSAGDMGGLQKRTRFGSGRQKRRLSGGQAGGSGARPRLNEGQGHDEEDEDGPQRFQSSKGKGRAAAAASDKWIDIHEGVYWDLEWSIEVEAEVECMTAIDDKHLLMTSQDGVLRILDVVTGSVQEVKDEKLPDVSSTIFWHPALFRWVVATATEWYSMRRDFTDTQLIFSVEPHEEHSCLLLPDGRSILSLADLGRLKARQMSFPISYSSARLPPAAATDLTRGMRTLAM